MLRGLSMTYSMTPSGLIGPGAVIGKFTIVRQIGLGGMCVVFEARHEELQKTVAIKTLRPEFAQQSTLVERFLREGKAASRVRHRHAIDMIDVGSHEGVVYLAMEYLEGEDLAHKLRRERALPAQATLDLLLPVMAAVVEAHDAGVVHRDLKPANIFLARSRRGQIEPKVLDFGISKLADDGQTQTATEAVLGTPFYMAPEQVRSARFTTPASDQYALGVILYQCLTGQLPFVGETAFATFEKVVRGEYARPRALVPMIPEGVEAAIVRAMALDPAARFASVAEMGAALLPFASAGARELWAATFTATAATASATGGAPSSSFEAPLGGTMANASREIQTPAVSQSLTRSRRGVVAAVGALVAVGALASLAGAWAKQHRGETERATQPPPSALRAELQRGVEARLARSEPAAPTRADAGTSLMGALVRDANARLREQNAVGQAAEAVPLAAPVADAGRGPVVVTGPVRPRGRDRQIRPTAPAANVGAARPRTAAGSGTPGRDSSGTLDIQ